MEVKQNSACSCNKRNVVSGSVNHGHKGKKEAYISVITSPEGSVRPFSSCWELSPGRIIQSKDEKREKNERKRRLESAEAAAAREEMSGERTSGRTARGEKGE